LKVITIAETTKFDTVLAIEPYGFITGSSIAYGLGKGFVPVRKQGKLPNKTITIHVDQHDPLEIHADAVRPGSNVLLVGTCDCIAQIEAVEKMLVERGVNVTKRCD